MSNHPLNAEDEYRECVAPSCDNGILRYTALTHEPCNGTGHLGDKDAELVIEVQRLSDHNQLEDGHYFRPAGTDEWIGGGQYEDAPYDTHAEALAAGRAAIGGK